MSQTLPFQGSALGLSAEGLARASSNLAVHVPEIGTVLAVETSGLIARGGQYNSGLKTKWRVLTS